MKRNEFYHLITIAINILIFNYLLKNLNIVFYAFNSNNIDVKTILPLSFYFIILIFTFSNFVKFYKSIDDTRINTVKILKNAVLTTITSSYLILFIESLSYVKF